MNNLRTLFIISGIILLLGIPPVWPYLYYILLRLIIFCISVYAAYKFYKLSHGGWALVFGVIAFLFNPISPVYMSKVSWIPIDFVSAIIFFIAAFVKSG